MSSFFTCTQDLPLLPDDEYEVVYSHHETWKYLGKAPKVTFWFKIVTMGDYFDMLLPRHFNVNRIIGKPAKNGRFKAGRSSDFLLEYCSLFPRKIARLDRIPLTLLENEIIVASTRTVTSNREQRLLPEVLQYSVIDHWLSIAPR